MQNRENKQHLNNPQSWRRFHSMSPTADIVGGGGERSPEMNVAPENIVVGTRKRAQPKVESVLEFGNIYLVYLGTGSGVSCAGW